MSRDTVNALIFLACIVAVYFLRPLYLHHCG